jgi:hypothetical protein
MRILHALLTLVVCLVITAAAVAKEEEEERLPVGAMTTAPSGEGWINLFSEENAGKWENVTDDQKDIFTIKDGIFHVPGRKPTQYIAWLGESFGDFEMHIEFKIAAGSNSGVFFRTDPKDPVQGGMEIQVYGDYREAPSKKSGGSLYDIASPMFNMGLPAGEWNSYDIRFVGSELEVVYNGWKVLDLDVSVMTTPVGKFDTPLANMPREGHIILQDHGDEVWFRNLLIRRL